MGKGTMFYQMASFCNVPVDKYSNADRCEVWGTSFSEPSEYCEYRFFEGDKQIATHRVTGY
jgi:hypothetical protein